MTQLFSAVVYINTKMILIYMKGDLTNDMAVVSPKANLLKFC